MLPIFKSDFSIGKSILTLDLPNTTSEEGADSIFDIAISNNFEKIILVEDSLTGFLQAHKNSEALNIEIIFGLRLSVCSDMNSDPKETKNKDESKVIIFAKNGNGCKVLNRIYSLAFTEGSGRIDYKNLKKLWAEKDVLLAIPFYDSFIFKNNMSFSNCTPDFSFTSPTFFVEDNSLPFDKVIEREVRRYCGEKHKIEKVKSIYYKNKNDFAAYQTYKCICNRTFSKGETGLTNPRLEHCGSTDFSFESWAQNQNEAS